MAEREIEIRPCGCGTDEICPECVGAERFAELFTAALLAQIREGEAS